MSIQKDLSLQKITRNNFLNLAGDLSLAAINEIPQGFNNNIIWNLGHVVVTHQLLCYKLAGAACHVSNEMIEKYRKGSSPKGKVSQEEVDLIKRLMIDLVDQTQKDFDNDLFQTYQSYTTSYGVSLHSFQEAVGFNNLHESMHLGFSIALKKKL